MNSKIFKKFCNNKNFKPTPNYIGKKIFDWLGDRIKEFTCLDLFSGSGYLGFEAAARGCKLSILLEKNKNFFFYLKKKIICSNFKNIKVYNCNYSKYIKYISKIIFYDLIFIDSPYIILKNLKNSLKKIQKISQKGTLLYIESIFKLDLIYKIFFKKINILKNNFFNKINYFLFEIL